MKCPVPLKTKNETVIEAKGSHNHDCNPGECRATEIVNQTKRRAQYSTATVAIAIEISGISDNYAFQVAMPKKTTCCDQSLKLDNNRCVFKYPPQLSLTNLLPSSNNTVKKMIINEV